MTSTCLQSCLCRNLKDPVRCRGKGKPLVPPDACCGECGGPQKAYASSLKVKITNLFAKNRLYRNHCKRVNNKFNKSYDLPHDLLQYRRENSAEYLYS